MSGLRWSPGPSGSPRTTTSSTLSSAKVCCQEGDIMKTKVLSTQLRDRTVEKDRELGYKEFPRTLSISQSSARILFRLFSKWNVAPITTPVLVFQVQRSAVNPTFWTFNLSLLLVLFIVFIHCPSFLWFDFQALLVLHQPENIELWNPHAPIETFWDIRYWQHKSVRNWIKCLSVLFYEL